MSRDDDRIRLPVVLGPVSNGEFLPAAASHATTITVAYNAVEKWAREHSYDAVIGIEFMMCAKPDGEITYSVYGTAVAWDYKPFAGA